MTPRVDVWIEHEKYRERIMEEIQTTSMTRHELSEILGLNVGSVGNLIRHLTRFGHIKKVRGAPCAITGRDISRYISTSLKYVPKDWSSRKAKYEANKAERERLKIGKPKKEPKTTATVVKVNSYTTIYLNSQRPEKDFAIKKGPRSRRNSEVAIGSGLGLFGSW